MKLCLGCREFSTNGVLSKIASSIALECTLLLANEVYKEMLNYIQLLEIFTGYKPSYKASLIDSYLIKKNMIFDFCYTISNEFLKIIGFIVSRRAIDRRCDKRQTLSKIARYIDLQNALIGVHFKWWQGS